MKNEISELDECCFNCKCYKDEPVYQNFIEKSPLTRQGIQKKMQISDGLCRRFPNHQPTNKDSWCGEFIWKPGKR